MIPTINYLLEFNKQNKFPLKIVIATANVSLQQQLLNQEIPSLNKAGLNFISVLAAGKNRYFCASNAINTLNNETLPIKETYLREELITAIGTNNWSGLKDDDHVQENL